MVLRADVIGQMLLKYLKGVFNFTYVFKCSLDGLCTNLYYLLRLDYQES